MEQGPAPVLQVSRFIKIYKFIFVILECYFSLTLLYFSVRVICLKNLRNQFQLLIPLN